jgi:hypothetical protein
LFCDWDRGVWLSGVDDTPLREHCPHFRKLLSAWDRPESYESKFALSEKIPQESVIGTNHSGDSTFRNLFCSPGFKGKIRLLDPLVENSFKGLAHGYRIVLILYIEHEKGLPLKFKYDQYLLCFLHMCYREIPLFYDNGATLMHMFQRLLATLWKNF